MNNALNQNLKLIYSSTENPFADLQTETIKEILKQAIVVNDIQTMANMTNLYTQSFISLEYKPNWLKCEFADNEWKIVFPKSKTIKNSSSIVLKWNKIKLNDGTYLSDPCHRKLLNTFKLWLTNTDNPSINGGGLLSSLSIRNRLYGLLKLIDCIIINGSAINLSKFHLSLLSTDFLIDVLISTVTVDAYGVPRYLRFEDLARNQIIHASSTYPATNNKKCLLNVFKFSADEYNRANNFIIDNFINPDHTFNYSELKKFIFKSEILLKIQSNSFINNILHEDYRNKEDHYGLYAPSQSTSRISYSANFDEVHKRKVIDALKLLKQLSFAANLEETPLDHTIFSKLNFNTIARLIDVYESGRFKTLPVAPILNLMRDTFEYSFKNIDEILESVIEVLEFQKNLETLEISLNQYERSNFSDLINQLYPNKLVCGGYLLRNTNFDRKKNSLYSNTLINRYNILISSVQFLFSIFSAKRTNEINNLKPYSNLIPDINPEDADYSTLFSVKSLVMKTGVGGNNETKAITLRPMIRSIAKLMWKIESFNKRVIQLGINLPSLFNLLGSSEKKLNFPTSITVSPYTYICDYFETPFINENGIPKKLYFSNHQLRRFFAMMFFWSNGYDGLDAIRWMLGHSSSEHLYHYITETCNGAVLNGIKAAHLVNEVQNRHLQTIDALRKAISQYYDVEQANIELERISDAITDYVNDEDYETRPSYISDKDLSAIEDTIYQLLHDDVIRLEPEFFTIVREGVAIQDYRMILEVRELV